MKDWYSPGEIRFNREEMIWLITWLPFLKDSRKWPPKHKDTGYVGSQSSRGHRAPFENPAGFVSEVESRLKTTREAGEALVDEVQGGITEYELLSRPARRALNYISGWRRRKLSFSRWKSQVAYREKVRLQSTR